MSRAPKAAKRSLRRGRGRPKGSTLPIERDRQRFAIALWRGFRKFGLGQYRSGYLAAAIDSDEPIRLEDVEGVLTLASTEINRTASSLDKHIDRLVRNAAKRAPESTWIEASATAIQAFILAYRSGNIAVACGMLDCLVRFGWGDQLSRLTARIDEAVRGNIPPRDGQLGRHGQQLLDLLKKTTSEKA
jgi:hypothetical protein